MESRFLVIRCKDGRYVKKVSNPYSTYLAYTNSMEDAAKYRDGDTESAKHDIKWFTDTHKRVTAADFDIVCFAAKYKEIKEE